MARPRPQPRWDVRDDYDDEYEYDDYDEYEQRRRIPKLRVLIAALVLAVLAAGGGALFGLRGGGGKPYWQAQPEAAAVAPVLGALGPNAKQPSQAALTAALTPLLADPRLGPHVAASVVDVTSGQLLFDSSGTVGAVPASTAKLVTAAAVLRARGPAYQIPTRAVAGTSPGEVVLIGGGDPTLAVNANGFYPGAARLDLLAAQVLKTLGDQKPTKVTVDASLFSGPGFNPTWDPSDRGQYITNISALMTDGGLKDARRSTGKDIYSLQPEIDAGQAFAAALGVSAPVTVGGAPPKADQLGQVLSLPISRMVETMLTKSDNMIAEAMARQVAVARGKPASFDGGAQATREELADLKLPADGFGLIDGSGLSYNDHVTAQLLTAVLAMAASSQHPELRAIISGLPVAGWSGTLNKRYQANGTAAAAGVVRAKTGTLRSVNSLAGVAVDADGRLLAFSVLADETPGTAADPAEAALDRVAATVAACGCS
jgi:D-alanyl-D-alanine carboxypeptidase/D-alanyl-D-alanine-endopeptidase (penicillin-binding protein 4)